MIRLFTSGPSPKIRQHARSTARWDDSSVRDVTILRNWLEDSLLELAAKSGEFAPPAEGSHVRIVRTAAAFRGNPVDILRRIFDVARFAVNAILGVDDETGLCAARLVRTDDLIDSRGTVEPRWFTVTGKIVVNRNGRVAQAQVNWLILLVICVGQEY